MKTLSRGQSETSQIAQNLLETLVPREKATILALEGDLGAGKTNFAQEVGKILGVSENMHSPTFVIMKVYEIAWQGFKNLIHIDAYRIEKESELEHLGWKEMSSDPENLILIEWPENIPNLIPAEAKRIAFKFIDEDTREIEIHGH